MNEILERIYSIRGSLNGLLVNFEYEGRILTIKLNRPERKNALTFEIYALLRDLFKEIGSVSDVRVVLISGEGGNFCSGGDVFEIIGPLTEMSAVDHLEFTRMTGDLVKAMRACPQPIVASVNGVAAGAGAILAMASDIRIASQSAKVSFLFSRVGLAGADMGACAILPRIVGHGRASELLFTGRSFDADEGLRNGFWSDVVSDDKLVQVSFDMAQSLADGPSFAHAMTKRMLHAEWNVSIDQAIEMEAQAQAVCMGTRDFRIAYEAFSAKRSPVFEGR